MSPRHGTLGGAGAPASVDALDGSGGDSAVPFAVPPDARTEVFDLKRLWRALDEAPIAPATRRVYRGQFVFFATWCSSLGLRPVPAHPEVVRRYLTSLAAMTKSASTIKSAGAAILMAHRLLGHEVPRSDRLARAMRELCWPPRTGRPPMPIEALRGILHACGGDPLAVRDRALLLVTLFAELRIADTLALDCKHAARDAVGYELTPHSSGDGGAGPRRLLPLDNPAFCPVAALDAWLRQRHEHLSRAGPAPEAGAIFVGIRLGTGATFSLGKRLRPEDVRRILKRRARAAGLDPGMLATHALRADPSAMAFALGAALPTTGTART